MLIEIGDDPIFDDCSRREIQIPTEWADGEVRFTVNQGAFVADDYGWVFIIDANGDPVNDPSSYVYQFDARP